MSERSDTGPFAIVPVWLLDMVELSDRAVRLYAVLADHADRKTGRCWPSRAALAARLGCSESSLKRAMHELVDVEAVEVTARYFDGDQGTNLYRVSRVDPGGSEAAPTPGSTAGPRNQNHLEPEPLERRSRRKPSTPKPEDFTITNEMKEWAFTEVKGLDLRHATVEWLTWAESTDARYVNWTAAWKNAMRRAYRWHVQAQPGGPQPARTYL